MPLKLVMVAGIGSEDQVVPPFVVPMMLGVAEPTALAAWQVGSAQEASAAQACGCDFIIAQGTEAGGHVRGTTALDVLLPAVLDAIERQGLQPVTA